MSEKLADRLWTVGDPALVRAALAAVRGMSGRVASEMIGGVSRGTVDRWRTMVRAGQPVEMEEKSRGAVIAFILRQPASFGRDVVEGSHTNEGGGR